MPGDLRVLFIGDVFSKPGRKIITGHLAAFREKNSIDLCICNAENTAGGWGITPVIADSLLAGGVDFITTGDHVWDRDDIEEYLDTNDRILRPLNYPREAPGRGVIETETAEWGKIRIINLVGRVFMKPADSPFTAVEEALKGTKLSEAATLVDFHAEATSEKIAMGLFLDGKVSAVAGTHTHVPTADEAILPNGTAYITDIGMTGSHDSVIGLRSKEVLANYRLQVKRQFKPAAGDLRMGGVIVDIERSSKKASAITRIEEKYGE